MKHQTCTRRRIRCLAGAGHHLPSDGCTRKAGGNDSNPRNRNRRKSRSRACRNTVDCPPQRSLKHFAGSATKQAIKLRARCAHTEPVGPCVTALGCVYFGPGTRTMPLARPPVEKARHTKPATHTRPGLDGQNRTSVSGAWPLQAVRNTKQPPLEHQGRNRAGDFGFPCATSREVSLRELCTWSWQLPNSGRSTPLPSLSVLIRLSLHARVPGDCEERLENPEEWLDADQLAHATCHIAPRRGRANPKQSGVGTVRESPVVNCNGIPKCGVTSRQHCCDCRDTTPIVLPVFREDDFLTCCRRHRFGGEVGGLGLGEG